MPQRRWCEVQIELPADSRSSAVRADRFPDGRGRRSRLVSLSAVAVACTVRRRPWRCVAHTSPPLHCSRESQSACGKPFTGIVSLSLSLINGHGGGGQGPANVRPLPVCVVAQNR